MLLKFPQIKYTDDCWFAAFGAFQSSLLFRLLDVVPSQIRFVVDQLLCFLIVGIQASGISIPLSL